MVIQIHETAIVDNGAQIGEGSRIWHWTHVSKDAVIGKECSLGQTVRALTEWPTRTEITRELKI